MCDPKLDDKSPISIETVKKGSDGIYSHHIYKKKALLGEGAFATVYKVVCANVATKEKQIYALKEISKSKITSNVRLQRVSFLNRMMYFFTFRLCILILFLQCDRFVEKSKFRRSFIIVTSWAW